MRPSTARIAAAVLVALGFLGIAPLPAHSADVHGDNGQDRYVGTGGLVLPVGVDSSTRAEVAGCGGCQWRLATPCSLTLPGAAFPGQSGCLSVVRGCPAMAELLRVWFQPSGGSWADRGLICLRPGGPVTIASLSAAARDRFVKDLPILQAAASPARGVLAQIPVIFASGQPGGGFTARYGLMGEQVEVVGRSEWTWDFGDGSRAVTDDPGGRYPHLAVSHAYRRAGAVRVEVRTTWSAHFSVSGLGPFPITEPVSQNAHLDVRIGEGRALLAVR